MLAKGPESEKIILPNLVEKDILLLEKEIDRMNQDLPDLTTFILPGGNIVVSYCHLARTVCRRAERISIKLNESFPVETINIKYLNRLSDYLFVLARKIGQDSGAIESPWRPRK
jgi:cob(I)alamin adenosyltransferase